jgi:pyridoxal biosynthesis lyase PdxS
VSKGLGKPMEGMAAATLTDEEKLQTRGW